MKEGVRTFAGAGQSPTVYQPEQPRVFNWQTPALLLPMHVIIILALTTIVAKPRIRRKNITMDGYEEVSESK
jgi:hypothetical protein